MPAYRVRFTIAAVLVLGFVTVGLSAERLTVEKVFDTKLRERMSTPRVTWLPDGRVLLRDNRVEREKRTLEIYDPKDGQRRPAVETARALASFAALLGEKASKQLEWPDVLAPDGSGGLYLLDGDIFLLRFADAAVRRLTSTPAEEEALAFSPDGAWVSFTRDNDIYAVELASGIEKRLTTGGSETLLNGPLSWVYWEEIYEHPEVPYAWSPDSKAIAYLQSDDSQVSISTFVNFKPITQAVVRQRYPKAGQPNPKVRLGVVELASAQTTWVDAGSYEYLARFSWLPNSREISCETLNRAQNELRLLFADRATGKSREILVEREPTWINLNEALYFLADGKRFIWMSERDGYQHLYLYGTDGRLINQLTKGEFMVLESAGVAVRGRGGLGAVDEKHGYVYFITNKERLAERQLYRVGLDGKGFTRLTTGAGTHFVLLSPDGRYFLDTYSNAKTPAELGLFRSDGGRLATITPAAPEVLAPFEPALPELINFRAEDGVELPATITKPKGFDPGKKYPALVYVYGGPGAPQVQNSWGRRLWSSLLAQEGFVVCTFEVRTGMVKSKALETATYKHIYGMQNLKDILVGVAWLKAQPWIDGSRLGIWGGSGGGSTTLFVLTHSDVFKAGVSLFPVSDYSYYDTIYTERYMLTPQENPEGYKDTSSVLAAGNLKGRLLIAYGTYDDNVHPQNTEAFVNALIAKNIQFDMLVYPWRKHGITDPPASQHLYTAMLDFWRRNLLP